MKTVKLGWIRTSVHLKVKYMYIRTVRNVSDYLHSEVFTSTNYYTVRFDRSFVKEGVERPFNGLI